MVKFIIIMGAQAVEKGEKVRGFQTNTDLRNPTARRGRGARGVEATIGQIFVGTAFDLGKGMSFDPWWNSEGRFLQFHSDLSKKKA